MSMKNLKQRAKEMTATLPVMEGREKGNLKDLHGEPVTIRDYGFLNGDDGQYAVVVFDEYPMHFFFGGSVLTQNMEDFEREGYHDDIVKEGLPALFETKKSKNNRDYTAVTFFPESEDK